MKKFISYFLIFALFLSITPVQVFSQRVEDLPPVQDDFYKKEEVVDYTPAASFKYDTYEVGKISPYTFVKGLEADLLNDEDIWDPSSKPRLGNDKLGTPEHLAQSYNDFLYYNIYPEESPLWNKTALIPGNGVNEEDVMGILSYHYSLSHNISLLFRKNPDYIDEKIEKQVRLIPVYVILAATFYVSWEVAPEIVTGLIPYFSTTGKLAAILKTVTSFAVMIAFDAVISDQVAWHLTQSNARMKYLYQSVGSYKNSLINVSLKTDLLKSVKETEYDRIQKDIKKMSKTNTNYNMHDTLLLKRYFKKGYGKIDQMYRPHLRRILGKFLYDLFDGDEDLINEYFRREMLRTYYALEFIKDELKNENDPLRYDRAAIDLATTYKIQYIQITDGRMIQHGKKEKRSEASDYLVSDLISALNLIMEKRYVSYALLEEHSGSSSRAKTILNMLENMGIIEKHYMWLNKGLVSLIPALRSEHEKEIFTLDEINVITDMFKVKDFTEEVLTNKLDSPERAGFILDYLQKNQFITKTSSLPDFRTEEIDFDLIKSQLPELKELLKNQKNPEVMTFGQNLQQIKGKYNLGNYDSRDLLGYINAEIDKYIGAELDAQTSVSTTYPTMLTRAEVNYLVQLMDIPKKKAEYEYKVKEERNKKARQKTYQSTKQKKESYEKKSNYKVEQIGEEKIDKKLEKVVGPFYNLSGTK